MMPVSGVSTGAAQPMTAAEKVSGTPKAQEPEEESRSRPQKPVMDEYIPEKRSRGKEEVCRGSTDRADREIERLKRKRAKLEQQLNTETDGARRKDLERQLAQVERELKQKDNDAYRRRHTQVTRLS